ncbi:unnamed protein product, partial [Meganyctiphanes norvegica]
MADELFFLSNGPYNLKKNWTVINVVLLTLIRQDCTPMIGHKWFCFILIISVSNQVAKAFGYVIGFKNIWIKSVKPLLKPLIVSGDLNRPRKLCASTRHSIIPRAKAQGAQPTWANATGGPPGNGTFRVRILVSKISGGFHYVNEFKIYVSFENLSGTAGNMPKNTKIARNINYTNFPNHSFRYSEVNKIEICQYLKMTHFDLLILGDLSTSLLRRFKGPHTHDVLHFLRSSPELAPEGCESGRPHVSTGCPVILLGLELLVNIATGCPILAVQTLKTPTFMALTGLRVGGNQCCPVFGDWNLKCVTLLQLAGVIIACYLLDKIGRKKSFVLSLGIMVVSLASLAVYVAISDQKQYRGEHETEDASSNGWIPVMCVMICLFGSSLGVQPVPFILMNEYVPTWVRPAMNVEVHMVAALSSFVAQTLYTPMLEGLTQAGLYSFYCGICIIGIPFTIFLMRETRGKQAGR